MGTESSTFYLQHILSLLWYETIDAYLYEHSTPFLKCLSQHIRMYIHTIQCIAHTGIFYPQRRCANIHPRTIKMYETNPCITPKKIHGSYVFFQCSKDIHLYSQRYINKHTLHIYNMKDVTLLNFFDFINYFQKSAGSTFHHVCSRPISNVILVRALLE